MRCEISSQRFMFPDAGTRAQSTLPARNSRPRCDGHGDLLRRRRKLRLHRRCYLLADRIRLASSGIFIAHHTLCRARRNLARSACVCARIRRGRCRRIRWSAFGRDRRNRRFRLRLARAGRRFINLSRLAEAERTRQICGVICVCTESASPAPSTGDAGSPFADGIVCAWASASSPALARFSLFTFAPACTSLELPWPVAARIAAGLGALAAMVGVRVNAFTRLPSRVAPVALLAGVPATAIGPLFRFVVNADWAASAPARANVDCALSTSGRSVLPVAAPGPPASSATGSVAPLLALASTSHARSIDCQLALKFSLLPAPEGPLPFTAFGQLASVPLPGAYAAVCPCSALPARSSEAIAPPTLAPAPAPVLTAGPVPDPGPVPALTSMPTAIVMGRVSAASVPKCWERG